MYPQQYLSLFPAFPREPRAFVAMSFDGRLAPRWKQILVPGIAAVEVSGTALQPFRVDVSRTSDAILTEVLQGIANSMFVVADITALSELDGKAVRNANVMYEVGIAHACRLPEEVLLLRSDTFRLDFDIAGVRVHSYDPDRDPAGAARFVTDLVADGLRAAEGRRRVAVTHALRRLTAPAISLLTLALMQDTAIHHPGARSIAEAIGGLQRSDAINALLAVGAIEAIPLRLTPELLAQLQQQSANEPPMLSYEVTAFGRAVLRAWSEETGMFEPEMREHMERLPAPQSGGSLPTA